MSLASRLHEISWLSQSRKSGSTSLVEKTASDTRALSYKMGICPLCGGSHHLHVQASGIGDTKYKAPARRNCRQV